MTDATQQCPVCNAVLPARAKFCGDCGTAIRPAASAQQRPAGAGSAGAATAAGNPVLPWFLAGCAALAIHATVIILAVRRPTAAPAPDMSNVGSSLGQTGTSGAPGRAPDISNLTPREAADRLYERIAVASESGDTAQVAFFAPMAINAYSRVSPLDADARLHLGLIYLAMGDPASAVAQADSITRFAGQHLFGPMLKARAAEASGDRSLAREAYRAFLGNYDAELGKNLQEYQLHARMLTEARTAAQRPGSR